MDTSTPDTAPTHPRGTHRLLAQWVRIVEWRPGGVIVQHEDGSVSREVVPESEIVEVAAGCVQPDAASVEAVRDALQRVLAPCSGIPHYPEALRRFLWRLRDAPNEARALLERLNA